MKIIINYKLKKIRFKIRKSGVKATAPRLAILLYLSRCHVFQNPESIYGAIKKKMPSLSLTTVYRNLDELAALGVIERIYHPNRQLYYFYCESKKHHHHFVCLNCQTVRPIDGCLIDAWQKQVEKRYQAQVQSHLLQLNGVCLSCSKKGAVL